MIYLKRLVKPKAANIVISVIYGIWLIFLEIITDNGEELHEGQNFIDRDDVCRFGRQFKC